MVEADIRIKNHRTNEVSVIEADSVEGLMITPEFREKGRAGRDQRRFYT